MDEGDASVLRALGGKVGKLLVDWFVDTDEEQREATERVERLYALFDLMMLAILADGELLDGELDALERRLGEAGELKISIGEASARIRFQAARIDTPAKMRQAMRVAASRLKTDDDRALAYQLAAELRRSGARLGAKRGGYRGNIREDAGLLNLFAEVLGIADADRDRLERAPLPAGLGG